MSDSAAQVPAVSVVVVAGARPDRLRAQLEALRAQTLAPDDFEVLVVDATQVPAAARVVAEAQRSWPQLRHLPAESIRGAAAARNLGRQAAKAPLIAFTEEEGRASQGWLAAGLAAAREHPDSFVQGPTAPHPDDRERLGPFSHTVESSRLGPWFEAVNVFYPRELLERAGGFEEGAWTDDGVDAIDLAWKAIDLGAAPVWAENALMYHAVRDVGPRGRLALAWRSGDVVPVLKRHPELRRQLDGRVFCKRTHLSLARAAIALAVPRRLWWLRWWLAAPYVERLVPVRPTRGRNRRPAVLAPYVVLCDLVELAAHARGRFRHRLPLL